MYQGQTEAPLFTATGNQSHYRLGANAKSLSKLCVRYLEEHTSLQVLTRTWDTKERDHSAENVRAIMWKGMQRQPRVPVCSFCCACCCKVGSNKSSLVLF